MWKATDSIIQPWPRKYYLGLGVQHRTDVRLNNYRCHFLNIVEKRTPEVVEDLASVILPKYSNHFWSPSTKPSKSNLSMDMLRYHRLMARSWVEGRQDAWWSYFEPVRDLLLSWAEWYQIKSDWVLQTALDAMLHWTWHHTRFDKFEKIFGKDWTVARRDKYAATLTPKLRAEFLREYVEEEQRVKEAVVQLPTYRSEPSNSARQFRKFEYEAWDGHDETQFFQQMKALFDQHLAHYRQEIEQRTASLDVVEKIKNLRQFDMLALYLCRGKTPEEIGKLPGLGWKEKSE